MHRSIHIYIYTRDGGRYYKDDEVPLDSADALLTQIFREYKPAVWLADAMALLDYIYTVELLFLLWVRDLMGWLRYIRCDFFFHLRDRFDD